MTVHNYVDSARLSPFVRKGHVLPKKSGRTDAANVDPPLPQPAVQERPMDMIPDSAQTLSAQDFTDPLIAQARFVNDVAALERGLARRKALRPARSAAVRKAWETRRGL